jgi:hypothetical protein
MLDMPAHLNHRCSPSRFQRLAIALLARFRDHEREVTIRFLCRRPRPSF